MFCPLGYTTLKKLWDANRAAFSWKAMDLDRMFELVFEENTGSVSAWMAKTLSTDELIEKFLFEKAFEGGLFLSSPSAQIMKIDVPFFISTENYHHIMHSTPEFFSENHNHFEPTHINPQRLSKANELINEGKDPWWELRDDQGFCSMNYYYDRKTYSISLEVYNRLEAVSEGYMFIETPHVKPSFIRPLEGWSICVTDETAEQLSPENLFERLRLKVFCDAFQLDEKDYDPRNQKTSNAIGRPKISVDAAQAFMRHYSLEDRPSWKEAINRLRTDDGLEVSVRTLQRGLKEISDDKSRS
jgi:hypothetical protein